MSLQVKLTALATAVGTDIGGLLTSRGVLANLTTTAKNNLVAAINELQSGLEGVGGTVTGLIDDAGALSVEKVWSSQKTSDMLAGLKSEILDGAPEAFDTLQEIATYLAANDGELAALMTALGNRVRFDEAQTLTTGQQLTACTNIGVGDPEADLAAAYVAARDA